MQAVATNKPLKKPILLILTTLFMIGVIEYIHPYFFLQDDNRTLYLPFYLHNLRAFLGGEFPFYNFHQYLGTPVTIQYASLYPLNYIALGFSQLLFGHYFAAMDIIALVHLAIAAMGFFRLLRMFGLAEVSCFFGAVAWTFCGFVITVGNSWIQTLGFAAYLPWILLYAIRQTYRFDISCFLILVVLKVMEFLLGYPQLFIYTMTFEFMTVALLYPVQKRYGNCSPGNIQAETAMVTSPSFIKIMFSFLMNYFFVFMITLPLILQTLHQTSVSANRRQLLSWEEYAAFSYNLKYWLNGLVAPFKSVGITTQFELNSISHIGYLTLIFLLLAMISTIASLPVTESESGQPPATTLITACVSRLRSKQCLVLTLIALFSLLWAGNILVTKLFYYLPVYNRLRFPFKVGFFTSFFLIMASSFGLDIFYNRLKRITKLSSKHIAVIAAVTLIAHAANFLLLYASHPQPMFSRHLDQLPLDEPLKDKISAGRIVSAGPDDVFDGEKIVPGFSAPLIGFDYATLWGLYHFGGYDPMVPEKAQAAALGIKNNPVFNLPANEPFGVPAETLEYFRKWGVRWYVVSKAIPLGDGGTFKQVYSDRNRNVLLDSMAAPMVYWKSDGGEAGGIAYRIRTNSVEADYNSASGGTIIMNILQHPYFSAQLDGRPLSVAETSDKQVSLQVPEGRHRVVVKYVDKDFINGAIISGCFIVLLTIILMFGRARTRIATFMS